MNYHMNYHWLSRVLVLTAAFSQLAVAADAPIKVSAEFTLKAGQPFFTLMAKSTGIKAALDADYPASFTVASVQEFRKESSNFDHIEKLESKLVDGKRSMEVIVGELTGQELTVDQLYGRIMKVLTAKGLYKGDAKNRSRFAGALSPIIGIVSGKGVLVRLDRENYVYNFGYAKGSGGKDVEQDKMERRTGRSYGASIARNAYDPSDNDYLKLLGVYAAKASEKELRSFYTVLFNMLLNSDASGLARLSEQGQLVMADFMAIYMAELDRHLMTGLTRYEWENALTEITMLAAYSAHDHGVTLDPRSGVENTPNGRALVNSNVLSPDKRLLGYFGVGTDGSGLDGMNKKYRHNLTRKISASARKMNPELVSRIEKLIGAKPGVDIFDETMEFVNHFKTQKKVQANAKELTKALVEFVMSIQKDARSFSADLN